MTTPYAARARSAFTLPSRTSSATAWGSRLMGRSVAAAAAGAIAKDRIGRQLDRRFGPQFDVLALGVEDVPSFASRLPSSQPFRPPAVPIRQNGKGHFVIDKSVVAPQPQAAAILPSPLRVLY